MTSSSKGNCPVVVAVDGSETGNAAVRWAAAEAVRWNTSLVVLTAFGFEGVAVGGWDYAHLEWLEARKAASEALLRNAAHTAHEVAPELSISTDPAEIDAEPALLAVSAQARLLVVGEPGRAIATLLTGSTALALASGASCPVVVVRGRDDVPPESPVVVGVDGSQMSEAALAHAFDEASIRRAPLVALHVWYDGDTDGIFGKGRVYFDSEPMQAGEERMLAERMAGWQEKYPDVPVRRVVVEDKPRQQLLAWSRQAQLVVVGSRGRGGFSGLVFGSTSQALLHHSDCPVMVARTPKA